MDLTGLTKSLAGWAGYCGLHALVLGSFYGVTVTLETNHQKFQLLSVLVMLCKSDEVAETWGK